MSELLLDAAGRRRSPATMPGFHAGRPPRNKGVRYPADPPTVEEIVAVMRAARSGPHGFRLRGLIAVLWRAGLRIHEALALGEADLDRRGALLVRRGKGGRRREVGMDEWGWEQLHRGEQRTGMDPLDPDSDDDGIVDGAEAGTVVSFADGRLVVRLANGESVTGAVTDDETDVRCDPAVELARWDEWDDDEPEWRNGEHTSTAVISDDWGHDELGGDWEDSDDDVSQDITCYADALLPGAIVHTAHLELVDDRSVFLRIQLSD